MKNNTLQQNNPNGWEEKSLGNFLIILKGKLPKKTYEIADSESVPYLSIKYLDGAEFKYAHKNDGLIADKNDLLVVADGSGSGRMYRGYYGLVSSTFLKISSQSPNIISNDYLEVIFSHLDFTKPRFRKGGAIPHFDFKQLKDVKILLPPLEEQQKIAEILGAVDEDIAKTQELIDTTEKLKRGLMQELLDGSDNVKIFNFSELVDLRKQKLKPTESSEEKYIALEHLGQGTGILLNIGHSSDTKSINSVFKKGDILFTKLRPYLRKYWKAEFDGICTAELLVFIPKLKSDTDFIFQLIQSDNFIQHSVSKSFGTKMPRTDWGIISSFEIPLPSPQRRQQIGDILSSIDEKILFNKKLKEKLITLKKGLMQDLLSGRVRVNIN